MNTEYYKKLEPFFGAWRITRLIGEGTYGKVFEIERNDFGQTYKSALKAISVPFNKSELRELSSEGMDNRSISTYLYGFVEKLVKEFALMSKLKGESNIVSYEDHIVVPHENEIGWDILIRMELLTPLNDYTAKKPMEPEEIVRLGIDMCRALELCKANRIIHRDVKPDNIFISDSGNFKLGDFGIARIAENSAASLTSMGTPNYMAPEVALGKNYGTSVDIYSLGIVMYRLLNNNRIPFLQKGLVMADEREAANRRRISGEPLPPPECAARPLADVVLKACAYLPADRYISPEKMRTELESILKNGSYRGAAYQTEQTARLLPDGGEYTRPLRSSDFGGSYTVPFHTAPTEPTPMPSVPYQMAAPKPKSKKGLAAAICVFAAAVAIGGFLFLKFGANGSDSKRYSELVEQAASISKAEPSKSAELLTEAQQLIPTRPEAYVEYAYTLYNGGEYSQCVDYCKKFIEKFPEDISVNGVMASAHFELGEYENAAKIYKALSQDDGYTMQTESLRDYAVCLANLGDLDNAEKTLALLRDKGAGDDIVSYILGEIYISKQDYSNAESSFNEALAKTDDERIAGRIYTALASSYQKMGNYQKMISTIKQAISQPSLMNNAVLHEMLGLGYYKNAQQTKDPASYRLAAEEFVKTTELGIQKEYLFTNAVMAYQTIGDYSAAQKVISQMKLAYPSSYTPYALCSIVMIVSENAKPEQQRNYTEAYSEYKNAVNKVTSEDDTTVLQQLEGLINQLKNGNWI